ncbi:DgyrCDS14241 [Dimorphilus gyrociliatus]|uniref:DgyrCDS14241 n=1 Tax=Dimorphilus gyrociliatus TaxID=2664684 RepID=A0A7I8WD16_9ANNE|nr:DgyrCDS14241 [Dimorphilus gyrociliatus]
MDGYLFEKGNKEVSEKDCRCLPCLNKEKLLETTHQTKVKRPLVLGSSVKEIKSQYRKLSKKHHPDKGGDHKTFMKIAKAYAALTDEESRKNWEEYGNPDGPTATNFGIALPIWIVEKQNSMWVLGLYALVFMIILPVVVGTWWYRSIQFSGDQVLLDTMKFYGQFFSRTPNMTLKRILMILGGSFEFSKFYNKDIIDRESDNIEIPQLMKELPNLNEKNKEKPFNLSYSLKARALIHAHLGRISLPPTTLENDKNYVLGKSLNLVNEMIKVITQVISYFKTTPDMQHKAPRLNTVEYCIKICQMLVQALWDTKSPLLQLPHITEKTLSHFVTKRRCIKTIKQFVEMKSKERRALLRTLSDAEYRDVMNVCARMPDIDLKAEVAVNDEEDNSITANSIVTVRVILERKPLEPNESDEEDEKREDAGDKMEEEKEKVDEKTKPLWQKAQKTKKKKAKKPRKAGTRTVLVPVVNRTEKLAEVASKDKIKKKDENESGASDESDNDSEDSPEAKRSPKPMKKKEDNDSDSVDDANDSEENNEDDNEEEDWVGKFSDETKKENSFETKSKETHLVHCPYYPLDKYEWWYLYVADKKKQQLISMPKHVQSLKDYEEVELQFAAPTKPDVYTYSVCLMSDSYMSFDLTKTIKLDVKKAKQVLDHPQWQKIDEDEGKENSSNDDEDSSDNDDYDDSDD